MTTRSAFTAVLGAAAVAAAAATVAVPSGVTHAYNAGVKFLDVDAGHDLCLPEPALPCTPGAGVGEPNVMTVSQNLVNGEYQYNKIGGTSVFDDHLWLSVDYDAGCRTAHHLVFGWVDGDIHTSLQDGLTDPTEADGSWGVPVEVGSSKNMAEQKVSLNVPIDELFDEQLFGEGLDADWFFDLVEDDISIMVWNGMAEEDARAMAFEMERDLTVQAGVQCRWNGPGSGRGYTKTVNVDIPITIKFLPVDTAHSRTPTPTDRGPGELQSNPTVTGLALSVVEDPGDPCTIHLSGTIQTDRPMTVEYRFIDPTGHISATHSVDVDLTHTAFVFHSIQVPMASEAEPIEDVLFPGQGPGQNYAAEVDTSIYSGSYTIEIVTPHHKSASDGFQVPYCETPPDATVRVDLDADDLTAGPNPTHAIEPSSARTSERIVSR